MWMALALLLPGLGLELTLQRAAPGLFVRVARAFLLSIAFWAIAIFATRLPFVSLRFLSWSGLAIGGVLVVRRAAAFESELASGRDATPALAFLLLTAAHLVPAARWVVAPGADMSMHTFMTRLIVEAGRLPTSYEPIFPIHDFGSYAAGLPTNAAVGVTLAGLSVQKATLVLALLAHPALVAGLSLVALRFAPAIESLAAAWIAVATCETHAYLLWGGSPTILSFALVFAAVACFVRPERGDHERFFPIFAAGAGLVHVIPLVGMAYAFPLALAVWLVQLPQRDRIARLRTWAPLVLVAVLLLAMPYALGAHPVVSTHEVEWVQRWQRDSWHSYRGTWHDFTHTIWPYLYQHFAYGVGVLAFALGAQLFVRDRRMLAWAPYAIVVLLLVLNSRYWVLPASPALYPERMLVLLLAPTCAGTAAAFARAAHAMRRWPVIARALVVLVTGAPLLAWSASRASLAMERAGERITVTANDLQMMTWMNANLDRNAVVANNYGDAGAWIPALAFRAVTHPHTNPFYFDEIDAWRMQVPADHLFIGERRIYDIQYELGTIRRMRGEYREIHGVGDAHLYVVLHPHAADPRDTWMGR